MNLLIRTLLTILAVLLIPIPVHSFKDVEHDYFTRQAWTLYREWIAANGSKSAIKDIDPVCKGTMIEDAVTITRARNWHFFNPGGRLKNDWLFNRSSGPRLSDLVTELTGRLKHRGSLREIGILSGRILHHIQDMSVPAHAVPIYHGPGLLDSFELYAGARKENFPIPVSLEDVEKALDSLPGKPWGQMPHYLYARDAFRTIQTVQLPINGLPSLHWADFWTSCDPARENETCDRKRQGFGIYGLLGNNFGRADFKTETGDIKIGQKMYDDFFRIQHRQLILTTIEWLYLYDRELNANLTSAGSTQ